MAQDDSNKISSIRYIKGLFKDTSHIDQPAGTVRYAKNAIVNRAYGAITNEEGNTLMASLPDYSVVIGAIPILDNKIILFIRVDDPNTQYDAYCEIGIYSDTLYETLLRLQEENIDPTWNPIGKTLNFQESNPIEGTFVEQGDGDEVVYWTDDLNSPRTLNITRQQRSSVFRIYGANLLTSNNTSYVGILDLFPNAGTVPHVEDAILSMGGECRSGVYYLALAYTDEDFTRTNFVTVANPISIVPATEGIYPIESYDGAPADTPTGKSIKWNITNINTDYKFLTAAVVLDIGDGRKARKLPDIEILGRSEFSVVFSGDRGSELFSVEEITIDKASYTKAKTITQLDGTLYLGNLESVKDLGYQKYANFITLTSKVKVLDPFDPFQLNLGNLNNKDTSVKHSREQGYRDVNNIFKYKGYTREEVYAFYIAFILRDGSMSYAYHIPGREPLTDVPTVSVPELVYDGENNRGVWETNPDGQIMQPATIDEGSTLYGNGFNNWNIMNITGGWEAPVSHFFQWFDFSAASGSHQMNFWNNLNEFYPDTEDWEVVDAANPNVAYDSLRRVSVRHHRFPSNLNEDRTTVVSSNLGDFTNLENYSTPYKLTVYYSYFKHLNGLNCQDATSRCADYEITGWSANQLSENTTCGDLEAWDDEFDEACDEFGIRSCNPTTNPVTDPRNTDVWQMPGNWCNSNSGPAALQEVDYEYSGFPPPAATHVIIGWHRHHISNMHTNAACGNIVYGAVESQWVSGENAYARIHPIGNYNDGNGYLNGDEHRWPWSGANDEPGWIAWAVCTPIFEDTSENALSNKVQALGFELSDVKIPKTIADQVQGFRIYHADRTHENRTVLGQNPLHIMPKVDQRDTAHCAGWVAPEDQLEYVTDTSTYFYPVGMPARYNIYTPDTSFSFHDFYLLNGQKDISAATHIKVQYLLGTAQYRGNVTYYNDEIFGTQDVTEDGDPSCIEPITWTAFFAAGDQTRLPQYLLNYVLRDKAKAYVTGGIRFKGKPRGFTEDIYNIGGETMIALSTIKEPPNTISGGGVGISNSAWNWSNYGIRPTNGSSIIFNMYSADNSDEAGLTFLLVNLKAFRTNLYNRFDTQDLVWTGYEVIGEDLNNFVVDSEGTPIPTTSQLPSRFTTEHIFGGDTFICRYGYRRTSREAVSNREYYPISNDIKSLNFAIVESTDNINFRHAANLDSTYFPGAPVADLLDIKADIDLTYAPDDETGNMKYNEAYSSVNNIKAVFPKPLNIDETTSWKEIVL